MLNLRFTKICSSTLLAAIAIPFALAVVSNSPGIHSTPGIWLMLVGLPGTAIGMWTSSGFGESNLIFYIGTALANWVFYIAAICGVIWLKRRFRERVELPVSKQDVR